MLWLRSSFYPKGLATFRPSVGLHVVVLTSKSEHHRHRVCLILSSFYPNFVLILPQIECIVLVVLVVWTPILTAYSVYMIIPILFVWLMLWLTFHFTPRVWQHLDQPMVRMLPLSHRKVNIVVTSFVLFCLILPQFCLILSYFAICHLSDFGNICTIISVITRKQTPIYPANSKWVKWYFSKNVQIRVWPFYF